MKANRFQCVFKVYPSHKQFKLRGRKVYFSRYRRLLLMGCTLFCFVNPFPKRVCLCVEISTNSASFEAIRKFWWCFTRVYETYIKQNL